MTQGSESPIDVSTCALFCKIISKGACRDKLHMSGQIDDDTLLGHIDSKLNWCAEKKTLMIPSIIFSKNKIIPNC